MSNKPDTLHIQAFSGRVEDIPLLRGRGCYSDDLHLPGQAYGFFVRSPWASGLILSIDTDEAENIPGVIAVLTAADMTEAGLGNVTRAFNPPGVGLDALKVPFRPALAGERVCHVGDPVALVIAETFETAVDAGECVVVDYDEESPVIGLHEATAEGAPQLWPEAPGNLAATSRFPAGDDNANEQEVDRIISGADHIAEVKLVNQRIVGAPMETRGATADYDPKAGGLILHCGTQGAAAVRAQLAAALDIPTDDLRVISGDVGGAFGLKTPAYPEYLALLVAVRKLGRPIHWMSSRSEAFISDNQGRDTWSEAELALDRDGRFLALRVNAMANMGAYLSPHGAYVATANFGRCFPTIYTVPNVDIAVRCIFTNTVPTGPYRGAGRPEANYVMERLIDEAARVTGVDPVSLRRRNMISPDAMPYKTPVGNTYDGGNFEAILDEALERAGYDGFDSRRKFSIAEGKRRGIGISCFLEHAGGPAQEPAEISFPADGTIVVKLGTQSGGQGHATIFRRLAATQLGVPEEQVTVQYGDTISRVKGLGTVASRSTMLAGSAISLAVERMLEKGREVAADALEGNEPDIDYDAGYFTLRATNKRLSLFEAAEHAAGMLARGEAEESLDTRVTAQVQQSFPNGCHIAEVEIDPDTGVVTLLSYTAIDDCGVVLDETLAEGQIQGGVAQGVGQALMEEAIYDQASGQLFSGSFMDYAMPRADDLPQIESGFHAVPCTTNPIGVKGVGEAGTTGALAAVMNAINNALPGDQVLDMPATPEKVWRACQKLGRN